MVTDLLYKTDRNVTLINISMSTVHTLLLLPFSHNYAENVCVVSVEGRGEEGGGIMSSLTSLECHFY